MLHRLLALRLVLLVAAGAVPSAAGQTPEAKQLAARWRGDVLPLVQSHCLSCHGAESPEARFDLSGYATLEDVARDYRRWEHVADRLAANEMPPPDAEQPAPEQRRRSVAWIGDLRRYLASLNPGDPGEVSVRRLNNAEYNYSIRDLTGVDIRPADAFPIDPANEAGFDNSAESLAMSPALLAKHLAAAEHVADHLVLTPKGIDFAPHPVTANTDRDKYCVKRIVDFYRRQPTDLGAYFLASRQLLELETVSDDQIHQAAAAHSLSPKYLGLVWGLLSQPRTIGPIAELQRRWRSLPAGTSETARAASRELGAWVSEVRGRLRWEFPFLESQGVRKSSQACILWRNRQQAAHRRVLNPAALPADDADAARQRGRLLREYGDFCWIFPDAFYISERRREYVGEDNRQAEAGRLLSAGFHSMMGYFRDDGPLCELILSPEEQEELDSLWRELDFVTSAPMRQYAGYIWFERAESQFIRDAEFDFVRSEDRDALSEPMIGKFRDAYLDKMLRQGCSPEVTRAVVEHFRIINEQIRAVERDRMAAEPLHLDALLRWTALAYRRPLGEAEREDLLGYYRRLRDEEELDHTEAVRNVFVSVLMSPHFCYRLDLGGAGEGVRPLNDQELACRLSFFLWCSVPDAELRRLADEGALTDRRVLLQQVRRMLQDPRSAGFAAEFAGNWLDFRRFEQHNSVDRGRFPEFTDGLRQAMYQEPIQFFLDVVRRDRSVLDFLFADDMLVNRVLAAHYGAPYPETGDGWVRVDEANRWGRGGLPAMAVFLTKNSPGLRTSPVKRGYWVVRQLLGEEIPAPPPNVPELPADESQLGETTLREALERHRADPACAACHDRFDAVGLVFEGYGPVGELRQQDLGGRAVDAAAVFPGGVPGEGLAGLRAYLREHRQDDFLQNFCGQLAAFAWGRTLLPTDDPLLQEMRQTLQTHDYRFSAAIETIVTSRQFLYKYGEAPLDGAGP